MSNLTALQQAMRIVEKHAHNLFNVYNSDSRAFLDEMSKCLELEQWQIEQAYDKGHSDAFHGRHGKHKEYYNETYKGGEQ
jgi:2-oxo-4-hydroxy-4-carboxy--5-ureidoimidazoline (OHCU) decarboxylase